MSSSPATGGSAASAWAEEAHALVQVRPRAALALAERALAKASAEGDVPAQLAALQALGWAQGVLGDSALALKTLRAGIRLGERVGDAQRVALLRRSMATRLAIAGRTREARREIEAALRPLSGQERARSQVHRMGIHYRSQVADPEIHRRVLADAAKAVRLLRREGDEIWEARVLYRRLRERPGLPALPILSTALMVLPLFASAIARLMSAKS